MTVDPAEAARAPITIVIEVLGALHEGSPPHRAFAEELSAYLAAEGVSAQLRYGPGEGRICGHPSIISVFVGTNVAAGVIAGAAWASLAGTIKRARERIRRQPPGGACQQVSPAPTTIPPQTGEPTVDISIYGPRGELLSRIAVNQEEINTLFGEPVEDPDAT